MFEWRLFVKFGDKKYKSREDYTTFRGCLISLKKALIKKLDEGILEEEDFCTAQVLDHEQVMWDYEGTVGDVLDNLEFELED